MKRERERERNKAKWVYIFSSAKNRTVKQSRRHSWLSFSSSRNLLIHFVCVVPPFMTYFRDLSLDFVWILCYRSRDSHNSFLSLSLCLCLCGLGLRVERGGLHANKTDQKTFVLCKLAPKVRYIMQVFP
jgi:hypothetical protein